MNVLAILPELILAATATLLLIADLLIADERKPHLAWIGVAGVVIAFLTLQTASNVSGTVLGGMVHADAFTDLFRLVFLFVAGLILMMSPRYIDQRNISPGEFYAMILFGIVGFMFMASGADLIMLYIGLELSSVSSYILIGMIREDPRSSEGSVKYLLNGEIASALILFGASLVFGLTGTTNLSTIGQTLSESAASGAVPESLLLLIVLFVVAGFAFKVAAVPFHAWTPDAYQGAATPITAFLSAGSKAAGVAIILRVMMEGLPDFVGYWGPAFAVLGFLAMTVGNVTALNQTNIKRMMAYSSIAQIGYVLAAVSLASAAGVRAALFYVMIYAFVELGVFSVITAFTSASGSEEIIDFQGFGQKSPFLAWSLVILFLSLVGIPPTGGFFGKLNLFTATIDGGALWLAVAIALNSVISLAYYFGVVKNAFLTPAAAVAAGVDEDVDHEGVEEAAGDAGGPWMGDWALQLAVAISVVFVLAMGIVPGMFFEWVAPAAAALVS